jgi:hypothetical protein
MDDLEGRYLTVIGDEEETMGKERRYQSDEYLWAAVSSMDCRDMDSHLHVLWTLSSATGARQGLEELGQNSKERLDSDVWIVC